MTKILVVGLAVILAAAGSGRADSTDWSKWHLGNERKCGFIWERTFIWERAFIWERRCAAGCGSAWAFKWERRCATGCGSAFEPERECPSGPPISD